MGMGSWARPWPRPAAAPLSPHGAQPHRVALRHLANWGPGWPPPPAAAEEVRLTSHVTGPEAVYALLTGRGLRPGPDESKAFGTWHRVPGLCPELAHASNLGAAYVDAPVSGSKKPARRAPGHHGRRDRRGEGMEPVFWPWARPWCTAAVWGRAPSWSGRQPAARGHGAGLARPRTGPGRGAPSLDALFAVLAAGQALGLFGLKDRSSNATVPRPSSAQAYGERPQVRGGHGHETATYAPLATPRSTPTRRRGRGLTTRIRRGGSWWHTLSGPRRIDPCPPRESRPWPARGQPRPGDPLPRRAHLPDHQLRVRDTGSGQPLRAQGAGLHYTRIMNPTTDV
jgi:hypothetical protein